MHAHTPSSTDAEPLVSVVSVNYNGAHLLPELLAGLRRQTWERREVLVVDNASTDGSRELLRRDYPEVRVVPVDANRGFVGGNNAGIRAAAGGLIALLNNDTVPEPSWLEELVRTMLGDDELAAVGSKLLFLRPYVQVRLLASEPAQGADVRGTAEVRFDAASAFAGCDYPKPVFREGFGPLREEADRRQWPIGRQAVVDLPLPEDGDGGEARLDLVLAADDGRRLRVEVGGCPVGELDVAGGRAVYPLRVPAAALATSFDLINNAGTALSPMGEAADRGIYRPDDGAFDDERDLEAICGAAVLLRRAALDRVGLFDRDFFMYYEDTDLSWRLRRAGYRLRYQPRSRIRHVHAASSVEWSPLFTFYTARNRVLMIAKNAGPRALLRSYAAEVRCMLGLLVRRWRERRGPEARRWRRELATRLRVHASLLWQLPRALLKRAGLVPHS